MSELFASIAFESQVGLAPQAEDEIVHDVIGRVTVMNEDSEDEQAAGVVEFSMVPLAEIRRREMNLQEIFYGDSEGLSEAYEALPDYIVDSAQSLVFIYAMEVEKRFRRPELVTRIVETIIAVFAPFGVTVAWAGDSVDVQVDEWDDLGFDGIPGTNFVIRTSAVAEGLEL